MGQPWGQTHSVGLPGEGSSFKADLLVLLCLSADRPQPKARLPGGRKKVAHFGGLAHVLGVLLISTLNSARTPGKSGGKKPISLADQNCR